MNVLIQQLLNAQSLGGAYALLALGLAIVFSIMGLINFAHGEIMSAAGHGLWFVTLFLVPFWLGILVTAAVGIVVAVLMERIAFRPVRNAGGAAMLLTSFAVSGILQVSFQLFILPRARSVPIPDFLNGAWTLGALQIGAIQSISIAATFLLLIALTVLFRCSAMDRHARGRRGLRRGAPDGHPRQCGHRRGLCHLRPVGRIRGGILDRAAGFSRSTHGVPAGPEGFHRRDRRRRVSPGLHRDRAARLLPEELIAYRDAISLALIILILAVRPQGLLGRKTESVR